MGIIGAILAIPIAAGLQVILTDYMDQRRSRFAIEPVQGSGWRWMLNRARERDARPAPAGGKENDFGMQVESEVYDEDDIAAAGGDRDDNGVHFEEAPRLLVDAERYGNDTSRAAEATWPSNPWRPQSTGPRESSPWRAAYRPGKEKSEPENP
jgi:hypothetical protein